MLRCHGQWFAGIRPLKGMGKVRIPGLNEAMDQGPQVVGRADTRPTQAFAAQNREPNLDLIEP